MRIGELGSETGTDVATIRYYEKAGLLPAPERLSNAYRAYGVAHVERLRFIRHCRALDMPLAEIRQLLDFLDHPLAACDDVDCLVDERLSHVRERIRNLKALERQLAALRSCCAKPHVAADCGILRSLMTSNNVEKAKKIRRR